MECPLDFLSSLNDEDKVKFCAGCLIEDDCSFEITFEILDALIDIAGEHASNRNIAVRNMLVQLNKNIPEDINVSGLVKKLRSKVKKIQKLSPAEKRMEMKSNLIAVVKELVWLNKDDLKKGTLCAVKPLVISNGMFLELCSLREKYKLNWQKITDFVINHLELDYNPSEQAILAQFKSLHEKISMLSKNKKCFEKEEILKTDYKPPIVKSCKESPEICDSYEVNEEDILLELDQSIEKVSEKIVQIMNESFEEAEKEIRLKDRKLEDLKGKLEREEEKNKNLTLEIKERNQQLAHYGAKNTRKREIRKSEKITTLENEIKELKEKIKRLGKRSEKNDKYYSNERKKVSDLTKKLETLQDKFEKTEANLKYFEDLSADLQCQINELERDTIKTFKDGKYTDEIRTVYYEMLRRNVSVKNCGDLIRIVLKKLANVDIDKLPKKSLAATMLVEMETLAKLQVREVLLSNDNNVLHCDGTKYNFEEVGGFQVSTASGSYTLGIENMHSGEATTYMNTLQYILKDMAELVVPEEAVDEDVGKILLSFKSLMTDRTIMNSTFFEQFSHWRKEIIPFVIKNYELLPEDEKEKISRMHHLFCGLHVLHNLGIYAEKALLEWEKVVEEAGNIHGGFKNSANSRTYDLLNELSKLTSYTHGDQRSGKADLWRAFLEKKKLKDHMISFLHHRFNVIFVLGGAFYFHRSHLKEFVYGLESDNFLHQSIKQDIDDKIFLASARALGIVNKLITGPLYRKVVEKGHIFDLNDMWANLLGFLEANSKDANRLLEEATIFDESYIKKDEIYVELFTATNDPLLDTLTIECLEVISCTCSLMVKSQLHDQLPGGKYENPSASIREGISNCPRTNMISERDFAQFDQKLTQKPTISTIAACGVIMFNNNKTSDWLEDKSTDQLERLVKIARTNKYDWIKKYKERQKIILQFEIDNMDKKKLEKEIKDQKLQDEKEHLTSEIQKVGGLIGSVDKLEELCNSKVTVKKLREILRNQILFRKVVLGQKFPDKKYGQMGETVKNKYFQYDVSALKHNLTQIINFCTTSPEERAGRIIGGSGVKDDITRKALLEKAKEDFVTEKEKTLISKSSKKQGNDNKKRKRVPTFFGKIIRHKMIDNDGEDVWYRGTVTEVLDDDEFDDECDFTVEYDGFDDATYEVKIVKEWRLGCIVIESKAGKEKKQKNI